MNWRGGRPWKKYYVPRPMLTYIFNLRLNYLILFIGVFVFQYSAKSQTNDSIPDHDNFIIRSKHVEEDRVINVWIPPNYEDNKNRFPVLYMPDGGVKEDFPHIANTLAKLIGNKDIPPHILVGIENTVRTRDLTGFSEVPEDEQYCPLTDGASNFRDFIIKELIPEINKKYRTTKKRAIIGESLAGLFVVETMLLKPNAFNHYIAMDPSLWWNDHYLVKNSVSFIENFPKKQMSFWFAGSNAEDIHMYTRMLKKTFEGNAPETFKWHYSDEPGELHNTIFRATKEKALIWSLNSF